MKQFAINQKGVPNRNKCTLEDCESFLAKNKSKYGVHYPFRSNKHELYLVKQPKIASSHLMMKDVNLIKILAYHVVLALSDK